MNRKLFKFVLVTIFMLVSLINLTHASSDKKKNALEPKNELSKDQKPNPIMEKNKVSEKLPAAGATEGMDMGDEELDEFEGEDEMEDEL